MRFKRVIDLVVLLTALMLALSTTAGLLEHPTLPAAVALALALLGLGTAALGLAGRAPWSPAVFVGIVTLAVVVNLVSYGPLAGNSAMAVSAVMIAVVFLSPRAVIGVIIVLALSPVTVGLLVHAGVFAAPVFRYADATGWVRMTISVASATGTAAVLLHLTYERLHRARLGVQAALAQARARHAEREEVEREIAHARRANLIVDLAAEVGADIGAALAIVTARAEALAAEVGREEARAGLADVIAAATTAASTMRSLTVLSEDRASAEHRGDVVQAARDLPRIVRRMLPTGITLDITADGEALVPLSGTDLLRILSNLVLNARDAITGTGHIRVAVVADAAQVHVTVADDGHGMDAATQAKVFQPFFTTKPVGRGTGLGLTTARVLVERAGGTMSLSSAPGEGTTFRIELPRVRP